MKKQTSTLIIVAAAAAAAFYFFKKKSDETTDGETIKTPESTEPEQKETPDATVTAPQGKFFQALEKAQEVATTLKDAAVIVKSGNKTAVVTSGKKKNVCPDGKPRRKRTKQEIAAMIKICKEKGYKGKRLRQCKRSAKEKTCNYAF